MAFLQTIKWEMEMFHLQRNENTFSLAVVTNDIFRIA